MMRIVVALLLILAPLGAKAQFVAQQTWCTGTCVGGTANAITLAIPNIVTAGDLIGVPIRFIPTVANTGAATIAVAGTPPLPVKKPGFSAPTPLIGGEFAPSSPAVLISDGTAYNFYAGGFLNGGPALTAPVSYYVSNSGSDGNNCLAIASPCLTIQHALTLVNKLNLNGYTVTINLADGVYAAITLPPINGSGTVVINGDALNPANTIIFNSTGGSAINAAATIGYDIENVLLESATNTFSDPGAGIWTQGANISLINVYYGSCSGAYIYAVGGTVNLFGNIVISGGVAGNSSAIGGGFTVLSGASISVGPALVAITINTPVTVVYFIYAQQNSNTNILYSSLTGSGNVTGTRYRALLNAVINTNGGGAGYYPGTGGSTASGAQYN